MFGKFGGHTLTYILFSLKFNKAIVSLIMYHAIFVLYHAILLKGRIISYSYVLHLPCKYQVNHPPKYNLKLSAAGQYLYCLCFSVFVGFFTLFVRYSGSCTDYLVYSLSGDGLITITLEGKSMGMTGCRFILSIWIKHSFAECTLRVIDPGE